MQLEFQNLKPAPLAGYTFQPDSFWQSGSVLFQPGNFYDIKAQSGKGKTTILDVIFGKRFDYTGDFFIDKKNADSYRLNDWAQLRKEKISYLFQGLRLFHKLTGMQNISIKNNLTGYLSQADIEELAVKLDLTDHLNKKAAHMSFGQRQRLSLIRALAQPFDWLLLDEPFSHIDHDLAEKAAEIIVNECHKREAGLIVTRLDERKFIDCDDVLKL